jgi:transposase
MSRRRAVVAAIRGGINRADITERFGVSVPQASKYLGLYEARFKVNGKLEMAERNANGR